MNMFVINGSQLLFLFSFSNVGIIISLNNNHASKDEKKKKLYLFLLSHNIYMHIATSVSYIKKKTQV